MVMMDTQHACTLQQVTPPTITPIITPTGFFLLNHTRLFHKHLARLQALMRKGELRVAVDPRRFVGLASVPEAVEYLHSGRSSGKVVVQVAAQVPDEQQQPHGRL